MVDFNFSCVACKYDNFNFNLSFVAKIFRILNNYYFNIFSRPSDESQILLLLYLSL